MNPLLVPPIHVPQRGDYLANHRNHRFLAYSDYSTPALYEA